MTANRYIVIGAGAVGATLAAHLHEAGIATVLVARGAHLSALRAHGLRHRRPDGEHVVAVPVAAGPEEVELAEGDVLVLATKAHDAEAAVAQWAWRPVKRADEGTGVAAELLPILTLQNGLDAERVALRRFATVYGAVVWSPASYLTPGEVVSPASPAVGVVWLGRYPAGADADGTDPRPAGIAADLCTARHLAEVVDDVSRWKAGKLLSILPNALDALYAPGPVRDRATGALRAEARTVYRAAGITPVDPASATALDLSGFSVRRAPGHTGRSTHQSLTRGVPPETDFLNGEIVLLARLAGVDAPRNVAIAARLHRAVTEGTPPGSLGDDDLRAVLPGLDLMVDAEGAGTQSTGPRPPGAA